MYIDILMTHTINYIHRYLPNVGLTLVHCLRRWSNINPYSAATDFTCLKLTPALEAETYL